MAEPIAFGAVAAVVLGSAFALVVGRNLVHCVLWLAAMLLATAVLFVLLGASFLGAIQVMLYAGGVVTLMLFAVMLTRRSGGVAVENEVALERRLPAALLSLLLFAGMAWAIHATPELPRVPVPPVTTEAIAMAFLTDYVLAFEVLSVLLLAATIGAIVIARKQDHGAEEASRPLRPGRPAVRPKVEARAGGAE